MGADTIARLSGVTATAPHPFTLDSSDTLLQLLRVLAYLGTFTTALSRPRPLWPVALVLLLLLIDFWLTAREAHATVPTPARRSAQGAP